MTTQLNLDPINTALCLAGFAIVWAFLFLRLYGEHRRRAAVWRAFWLHPWSATTTSEMATRSGLKRSCNRLRSAARRRREQPRSHRRVIHDLFLTHVYLIGTVADIKLFLFYCHLSFRQNVGADICLIFGRWPRPLVDAELECPGQVRQTPPQSNAGRSGTI